MSENESYPEQKIVLNQVWPNTNLCQAGLVSAPIYPHNPINYKNTHCVTKLLFLYWSTTNSVPDENLWKLNLDVCAKVIYSLL